MSIFSIGQYYDHETGRSRYAVYCSRTSVWYFPKRYGRKAAEGLLKRLRTCD